MTKAGDVPLPDRDQVVQPGELVEPAGRVTVLLGQVDGGDPAAVLVGQETGGAADPAAGVEHVVCGRDRGQFGKLAGGDPAHRVEVLEQAEVGGLEAAGVLPGGDEGLLDVLPGQAGAVLDADVAHCFVSRCFVSRGGVMSRRLRAASSPVASSPRRRASSRESRPPR